MVVGLPDGVARQQAAILAECHEQYAIQKFLGLFDNDVGRHAGQRTFLKILNQFQPQRLVIRIQVAGDFRFRGFRRLEKAVNHGMGIGAGTERKEILRAQQIEEPAEGQVVGEVRYQEPLAKTGGLALFIKSNFAVIRNNQPFAVFDVLHVPPALVDSGFHTAQAWAVKVVADALEFNRGNYLLDQPDATANRFGG